MRRSGRTPHKVRIRLDGGLIVVEPLISPALSSETTQQGSPLAARGEQGPRFVVRYFCRCVDFAGLAPWKCRAYQNIVTSCISTFHVWDLDRERELAHLFG